MAWRPKPSDRFYRFMVRTGLALRRLLGIRVFITGREHLPTPEPRRGCPGGVLPGRHPGDGGRRRDHPLRLPRLRLRRAAAVADQPGPAAVPDHPGRRGPLARRAGHQRRGAGGGGVRIGIPGVRRRRRQAPRRRVHRRPSGGGRQPQLPGPGMQDRRRADGRRGRRAGHPRLGLGRAPADDAAPRLLRPPGLACPGPDPRGRADARRAGGGSPGGHRQAARGASGRHRHRDRGLPPGTRPRAPGGCRRTSAAGRPPRRNGNGWTRRRGRGARAAGAASRSRRVVPAVRAHNPHPQ